MLYKNASNWYQFEKSVFCPFKDTEVVNKSELDLDGAKYVLQDFKNNF